MTQENLGITIVPLAGGSNNIVLAQEQWFSLKDMLVFFARRWWVFAGVMALSLILGLSYLRTTPVYYEATMIIAGKDSGNFLSQDSGSLLEMLSKGKSSTDQKIEQFIDMMLLEPVVSRAAQKHDLLRRIYSHLWDPAAQKWVQPQGGAAVIKQRLQRLAGRPAGHNPTVVDLMQTISANFTKTKLEKSGFYRLSYRSNDPKFAALMLQSLFNEANEFQREAELAKNRKRLQYLEGRMNDTKDVFHRREIQTMMRGIENALMVAFVDETIAVDVIDSVSEPIQPAGPRMGKTLAISIMLGFLAALGGVWIWFMLRRC